MEKQFCVIKVMTDGEVCWAAVRIVYSRASLIRTNWDLGMFGWANFRINRVLQNTRPGGGGSEISARSRVKVTTRGG
jgi:hypothetical protein